VGLDRLRHKLRYKLLAVEFLKAVLKRVPVTSFRIVMAAAITMAALKRHLELYLPVEIEIWDCTDPDKRKHHVRPARLVFTLSWGRTVHRSSWAYIWVSAVQAAGFTRRVGPHSLRHDFATRLIHNGSSARRVRLALGHSTPTTTLNTYVGEWPDTAQETSAIMDAALGQVPRMCPPAGRLR
jgi:integrase